MKIKDIKELLDAELVCGEGSLDRDVMSACGSDMMSDVLAFVKNQAVLLTGLVIPQVIKTAEMMDMHCIVFVRATRPTPDMIELAVDADIALLCTSVRMFEACGILYEKGLRGSH